MSGSQHANGYTHMGADAQCMRLQLLVSQMLSINNNNNDSNNRRCFPAQDELGMCRTSLVSPSL